MEPTLRPTLPVEPDEASRPSFELRLLEAEAAEVPEVPVAPVAAGAEETGADLAVVVAAVAEDLDEASEVRLNLYDVVRIESFLCFTVCRIFSFSSKASFV